MKKIKDTEREIDRMAKELESFLEDLEKKETENKIAMENLK